MTHAELAILEFLDILTTDLAARKAIDLATIDKGIALAQEKFSAMKFSEAVAVLNILRASTNEDRQKALAGALALLKEPPGGNA